MLGAIRKLGDRLGGGLGGKIIGPRHERPGFQLYVAAVQAARRPELYMTYGVPDTLDGRFEMIGVYVFLLIRRLRGLPPPGEQLAQVVFDAMFSDMDVNLRELGVGDLSVGKRVRRMWEAFHGRAAAYQSALESAEPAGALGAALARNVWRGAAPPDAAAALARHVIATDRAIAASDASELGHGRVVFPPALAAS